MFLLLIYQKVDYYNRTWWGCANVSKIKFWFAGVLQKAGAALLTFFFVLEKIYNLLSSLIYFFC